MDTLKNLPASLPGLYDPSYSVKLVGVAGKYDRPEGPLSRFPEHTVPGGSNEYHCSKIEGSWTSGYFAASLWLMVERLRLLPAGLSLPPSLSFYASPPTSPTGTSGTHSYLSTSPSALFSLSHFKPGSTSLPHPEPTFDSKAQKALEEELISIAKRYSSDLAPCADKDEGFNKQGFKFGTCFAKQYELLDEDEAKDVLVSAAKALAKGWDEKIGAIRSVNAANLGEHRKSFTADQKASHFLVTIDSLANLSILFNSSDEAHHKIAEKHAETVLKTFIRDDGKGVWELVNFGGAKPEKLHIHGTKDGSGWSRGLAWAIYGFAHAALHTGRKDFVDAAKTLAETLNASLPADGVPYWDAHVKTHRDATAATIAASGLLALYKTTKDEVTLSRAFKLIKDTLAHCKTGRASGRSGGVDMGKEGWETLLRGSTEDSKKLVDIGTVYADYYLLEFGNEALKLQKQVCS